MIRVTVWNEYYHEKTEERVRQVYPAGIHNAIADFLRCDDITVRTATLDDPECGLTEEVLKNTDVLIWWGHLRHHMVPDEVVERVCEEVRNGMGFIGLHSAHKSKPLMRLLGTRCDLRWREGERERIWTVNPAHPIAKDIPAHFSIDVEEMYGERFDIPEPDELVFLGWFAGGEVFRSGCCWNRGLGKIFYFQPGHESNPSFHNEYVQRIIINAVRWAVPANTVREPIPCPEKKISPEERYKENRTK